MRQPQTLKKRKRTTLKRRRRRGGKPIASGTYGCVFNPALKCKDHSQRTAGVSKLMLQKHKNTEMKLIETVKSYTDTIPHHQQYFLVDDVTTCTPGYITGADMDNFNAVCSGLVKKKYTSDTVNKHLQDLRIINIPYGGKELIDYFATLEGSPHRNQLLIKCNNACVDLLVHAIVPLNQKGFLHNDIKYDNILMGDDSHCRLIDYGLGSTFDPQNARVPDSLLDYSLAYNKPFSSILFQSGDSLNTILASTVSVATAANQILMKKLNSNKGHHEKIIKTWMPAVLGFTSTIIVKNDLKTDAIADAQISEYITVVLQKYQDEEQQFKANQFFNDVYRHNADVWGFLTIYFAFLKRNRRAWPAAFYTEIRRIIKKYCYSLTFAVTPIPIGALEQDLRHLNTTLLEEKPSTSRRQKSSTLRRTNSNKSKSHRI